jgi:hypothetical protein
MKVRVKFPMLRNPEGQPGTARSNHKAIREELLLDTTGSGVEKALVSAAESAAGADQNVYVTRSYGPSGRLSVWIVDESSNSRRDRKKDLRAALARVQI